MKSWLYCLNYGVFQWFGCRLARVMKENKQTGWKIMTNIKPLSGWEKPFERWF